MRIDLVITELFVGGAERCLAQLAGGLAANGHAVRVASIASLPQRPQAGLVQALIDREIPVASANCDRYRDAWRAQRWLRRWFQQGRPDVVQTMLFHANTLGAFAAARSAVPRLVGGIRVAERSRWRRFAELRAVRRMDAVVCVSDSVRRFAETEFGSQLPLTKVIPNSIDLAAVDATAPADWTELGWPADAQVMLFVGRLHPQKGTDVLARALETLLERFSEMRCCLVGEGPQRAEWDAIAGRVGRDRVRLLGWRPDAIAWIKGCRLLVLPSRYEGMPNVVLEAMAAAKPVAVSLVEGVRELLGDATSQQSCPAGDVAAFETLVTEIWRDPILAGRLGGLNRQQASLHHSPRRMIEQYEQLYRSLQNGE